MVAIPPYPKNASKDASEASAVYRLERVQKIAPPPQHAAGRGVDRRACLGRPVRVTMLATLDARVTGRRTAVPIGATHQLRPRCRSERTGPRAAARFNGRPVGPGYRSRP